MLIILWHISYEEIQNF